MTIVAGIDGGGTHTRVRLVGPHGWTAEGSAGPSNPVSVGLDEALVSLAQAWRLAWQQVPGPDACVASVHAGIAGAGDAALAKSLHQGLAGIVGAPSECISVSHDLRTSWSGAFEAGPAILVIAGTGSSAFAVDAQGGEHRCGGWGALLDDAGGGYHLGLLGLQAVVRAEDGRSASTSLRNLALRHFGLTSLAGLPRMLATSLNLKAEVAAFGQIVLAEGPTDGVAKEIARAGAQELARFAGVLARRLVESERVPCAITGGLMASPFYKEKVRTATDAQGNVVWQEPAGTALDGAVRLARLRIG